MEKIFGIDLGTTNSEIAYVKDGKPEIITVADGKKYLPSVVGTDAGGKIITGFSARNQRAAFPENTVASIKRKMGSGEKVSMAGQEYTPAEISSYILKTLKEAAERETGMPVEKVVITVPAYFNDAQRKETILAGELSGLEVVRIINEPTSAALAYGCREERREKILVYDLGGGTFDISLIDVEEDVVEVIASDGDTKLGGDDFDYLISRFLASWLPDGVHPEKDLRLAARLKNAAESTKIALSTHTTVDVKEGFLATVKGKPVNLELMVTRQEVEERIEDILEKTFKLLRGIIKDKKIKSRDISKILLVGGSTNIPMVFNRLTEEFDIEVHRGVDPTYCVAIGAAIQGAIISGEEIGTILVDVTSHSLGIRCVSEKATGEMDFDFYSAIIHRNTPIPASMSETYYTMVRNQNAAAIEIFQGEESQATKNTLIGSFSLEKLPQKLPAGSEIDVTFVYNIDGIVEISASERKSGGKEKMKVDINRIGETRENQDAPEPKDQTETHIDERRIKRILKTAYKIMDRMEDPSIRKKLDTITEKLEHALSGNNGSATEISEELAEILAEI
jgi:molecular chaperone DnaK